MSRTFNFIYKGLTRDDPYEAIFADDKHSDFNFTVKKAKSSYSVTCYFRAFTLNTETVELSPAGRTLTENDRTFTYIFIREKDEYMNSDEFKTGMRLYQIELEQQLEKDRIATSSGSTSPRLFVPALENVAQIAETKLPHEKGTRKGASF